MPRRARMALTGAGFGVVLLALTWYARAHIGVVERADRSILLGFAGLARPTIDRISYFFVDLCNPKEYVILAAIPVLVALLRRRPRAAIVIGAVILSANTTTQLLKPLLAPSGAPGALILTGPSAGSWPSGHATAAMSLALGSVIAAPAAWRPRVAAFMGAFAVVVCYSFLELRWHYPSDVLGGFLVAATWALLGTGGLSIIDGRWPQEERRQVKSRVAPIPVAEALAPVAIVLLAALLLAAVLAIARPHAVVTYARVHEAFIFGAAGIGALALTLATGAVFAFRGEPPEA